MKADNRQALFETMPVPVAVAKLCIPTILSSLVMVFYNIADTYFVASLNDPVQTAAVTLAGPLLLAFNAVNNLFGIGCSSMMSRALGAGDLKTLRSSSAFGFYGALLSGLLFSLIYVAFSGGIINLLGADSGNAPATFAYLKWTVALGAAPAIVNVVMANLVRAEGAALHASIGAMSGSVLNIILDPFFIMPWGFDMGAEGAGCATFISSCVACLYFLGYVYLKRRHTGVSLNIKDFLGSFYVAKGVTAVGVPAAIQNLLNVANMTILNNLTAVYGTAAVAAMGIAHKVQLVPIYITMGIGAGITPLIGYNFSQHNRQRMKEAYFFTAKWETAFLIATAVLFIGFPQFVIGLFTDTVTVVQYGAAFLRGMGFVLIFAGLDFLGVGVFNACGLGRLSLLFALLRKIVLEIPLLLLLNFAFGMYGLPYAQAIAEFVLAGLSVFFVMRILKGKIKNSL